MPQFKVTIMETSVQYKSKVFKARSESEARRKAEAEDWRDKSWEPGFSNVDTGIEEVEAVK
jgi:hypothetical protein